MGKQFQRVTTSNSYIYLCPFCNKTIYSGDIVIHCKNCCESSNYILNSKQKNTAFILYTLWITKKLPQNFTVDEDLKTFVFNLYAYFYFVFIYQFEEAWIFYYTFTELEKVLIRQVLENDIGLVIRRHPFLNYFTEIDADFNEFISPPITLLNLFYQHLNSPRTIFQEDGVFPPDWT